MKKKEKDRTGKNKFLKLSHSCEWDTFKAQLLEQVATLTKPKTIAFDDYNVVFTVPRRCPNPIPLIGDTSYEYVLDRAQKAKDPVVNIIVEACIKESGKSKVSGLSQHDQHRVHLITQNRKRRAGRTRRTRWAMVEMGPMGLVMKMRVQIDQSADEGAKCNQNGKKKSKVRAEHLSYITILISFQMPKEAHILKGNKALNEKIQLLRTRHTCHAANCSSTHCYISPDDPEHLPLSHPMIEVWVMALVCYFGYHMTF